MAMTHPLCNADVFLDSRQKVKRAIDSSGKSDFAFSTLNVIATDGFKGGKCPGTGGLVVVLAQRGDDSPQDSGTFQVLGNQHTAGDKASHQGSAIREKSNDFRPDSDGMRGLQAGEFGLA